MISFMISQGEALRHMAVILFSLGIYILVRFTLRGLPRGTDRPPAEQYAD